MITRPWLDLQPQILSSFVAVAEQQSFTAAGIRLGLGQSTVSQHVQRLERVAGCSLLLRSTHSVSLTSQGATMLDLARLVLDANGRMAGHFSGGLPQTQLRLGISEDFAMSELADVLASFRRREPHVDIALTVALSGYLYQRFDAGEVDVIFVKRKPGDKRGRVAWRERLAWIGAPGFTVDASAPFPLVAYSPPSITRSLAIKALEASRRPWKISCSSGSLNGLQAALAAGMGAAAHSSRLVPSGLAPVSSGEELPPLPEIEFVVIGPGKLNKTAARMVDMLLESAAPRQSASGPGLG